MRRYSNVAIGLHWLIAVLIIGLVAVGKFMTGLEVDDPLRFALTQWHKSLGISVLLLSVIRLLWRLRNRPPAQPSRLPRFNRRASAVVHFLLYCCLFFVPITGWILVSVSPLNIETLLFDVIPWPHLEPFASFRNKEGLVEHYAEYHTLAGNLLLLLMLVHIGAALKHKFFERDEIMRRMTPGRGFAVSFLLPITLALGAVGAFVTYSSQTGSSPLLAGASAVGFEVQMAGEKTLGIFAESTVNAVLDESAAENSSIVAVVQTAGVSSDNAQVQASLPGSEWFDVEAYPEARFESTAIDIGDSGLFNVTGFLTIKTVSTKVSFPMAVVDDDGQSYAVGEFSIDRRKYNIGMQSQATDEYVNFDVLIRFRFELESGDA